MLECVPSYDVGCPLCCAVLCCACTVWTARLCRYPGGARAVFMCAFSFRMCRPFEWSLACGGCCIRAQMCATASRFLSVSSLLALCIVATQMTEMWEWVRSCPSTHVVSRRLPSKLPALPKGALLHDVVMARSALQGRSEDVLFATDATLSRRLRRGLSFLEPLGRWTGGAAPPRVAEVLRPRRLRAVGRLLLWAK